MSGEVMEFPKTAEEFMEKYKIIDSEQVYTNGAELVPIFRMKQWFEHLECENCQKIQRIVEQEWMRRKDETN